MEPVDEVYLKKRIPPEIYQSDDVFGDPLSNSMEDSIERLRSFND